MDNKTALSINQFQGAWELMCSAATGYARSIRPGLEKIFSCIPMGFFNMILLPERVESAAALALLGSKACAEAAAHQVPWMLLVTHETLAPGIDAAATLTECGFAPVMPLTGMIADDVAPPAQLPPGLELTVPRDHASCAAIVTLNGAAYGMDLQPSLPLLGSPEFWKIQFPVVGKLGGQPVSCAATFLVDGYRYVALVATHPEHQRRGYADAAMRRSLDNAAAAKGKCPTVLHATEAGRPVYERMGYSRISSHTLFMEKTFLAAH